VNDDGAQWHIVELHGDIRTRVAIGCESPAATFAEWARLQGYSVSQHEGSYPSDMSEEEWKRGYDLVGECIKWMREKERTEERKER